jgi:hypothetical protein
MLKRLQLLFTLLKILITFLLVVIIIISFKKSESKTTTTIAVTTLPWSNSAVFLRKSVEDLTNAPEILENCYTMSTKSFKAVNIPEFEQFLLHKLLNVLIIVGDVHYGFLAASANVKVHSFGLSSNKMEILLRNSGKNKHNQNWDFNNIDGMSPFIDFMIIEQWTYNEDVILKILQKYLIRHLVILNTLLGQCPPFAEYTKKITSSRCTSKLNYVICDRV